MKPSETIKYRYCSKSCDETTVGCAYYCVIAKIIRDLEELEMEEKDND